MLFSKVLKTNTKNLLPQAQCYLFTYEKIIFFLKQKANQWNGIFFIMKVNVMEFLQNSIIYKSFEDKDQNLLPLVQSVLFTNDKNFVIPSQNFFWTNEICIKNPQHFDLAKLKTFLIACLM